MRGLAAVAALGLALLPTTFAQKKPFAIPDSLRWEMGNDLSSRMKAASVTKINRWSNAVPVACYQEGQKFVSGNSGRIQCELDQLTVFEAWFSDAQTPWVICRCKDTTTANPKYTEADLLAEIGKVPVAFRQYTRMFIGFGQSAGGKVAYSTWDKDIILMNMNTMNVMHEVGHQVDPFWATQQGKHALATFKNAINQDTCWPTWYSQIAYDAETHPAFGADGNLIEIFAEAFWLRQYQKVMGSWPSGINMGCASRQINAIAQLTDSIQSGGYNPDNVIDYDLTNRRDAIKASNKRLVRRIELMSRAAPPKWDLHDKHPPIVEFVYSEVMAKYENGTIINTGTSVPSTV